MVFYFRLQIFPLIPSRWYLAPFPSKYCYRRIFAWTETSLKVYFLVFSIFFVCWVKKWVLKVTSLASFSWCDIFIRYHFSFTFLFRNYLPHMSLTASELFGAKVIFISSWFVKFMVKPLCLLDLLQCISL